MKVLITGAGGNLGKAIIPSLIDQGYQLRLMDMISFPTPHKLYLGDISSYSDVSMAVDGMDIIIHGAALHGIHLQSHTIDDFWRININGTHNIMQAAVNHGIKKIIFCSTTDVYGKGMAAPNGECMEVTENNDTLPNHIYGLTKMLGERMCEYYSRIYRIKIIAFRLGIFLPEEYIRHGFRLLKGGIDERDVAQAFVLAVKNNSIDYDVFNIMSKTPFQKDDNVLLMKDPMSVLEKYFPGMNEICRKKNIPSDIYNTLCPWWGNNYFSISKAAKILGYSPKYDFTRFLSELSKT